MKITNVVEIYDNGEFVSIITKTGSAVHLPIGDHSITIHSSVDDPDDYDHYDTVYVDLFNG